MIESLMFSGGVDSVVCLNRLVNEGIVPILFHFKTKKISKANEIRIRKIAKIISPESPYYCFESIKKDYVASALNEYPYYVVRWRLHGPRKYFCPLEYSDVVYIGYTRWVYRDTKNQRFYVGNQHEFIDKCNYEKLPFKFLISDLKRPQVDKEFNKLHDVIKLNVVSSTRHYDFGGRFI